MIVYAALIRKEIEHICGDSISGGLLQCDETADSYSYSFFTKEGDRHVIVLGDIFDVESRNKAYRKYLNCELEAAPGRHPHDGR